MFQRIAHVCLHVRDLGRSVAFYEKLGLVPRFHFTRQGKPFGVYLEIAPGSYVEMFQQTGPEVGAAGGIAHFCLETDDIDRVMQDLGARGVPFTEKKLGCDHTYQIWLTDPDGNRFEVHQYTAESLQRAGGVVEADW